MASLGHVAVGMAVGRAHRARSPALAMVGFAALSLLPDLDVIAFALDVPYAHPFGHRGASHSLFVALVLGGLLAALWPASSARVRARAGLLGALTMASHGLLDTLTDGGLGVALLWPLSDERFFAPWRPIPVAPIGADLLSWRGVRVISIEAVYFAPLVLYALWPRNRS